VVVVRAPTNPRTVFDPIQTALPSPPPRRCRHAALHNVPERCSPALSLPVQAVLAAMGLGAGSVGAARGDGRGGPGQSPEPGMVIMLNYHNTGHDLLPMRAAHTGRHMHSLIMVTPQPPSGRRAARR
jgi:hypothetical protein